ncbi:hypothetical protein DFH09DRAFT_1152145 [Mycena vulgaris]|nr:hypothetical protein DFH09DRAFT_1187104 [Mycena vulgaris]KAJ6573593.1 hypothetical protein DFH09DRAFT_1152145 [Mycena vulgaris]
MADTGAGLTFIVVGASIAGLASAIGLKASGHKVLVLEKETQLGGTESILNGCARVPPNGYKVLSDWGLENEIRAKGTVGEGFAAYKYDGGKTAGRNFLGMNLWNPELLHEARGDFVSFLHKDLLRILHDAAIRNLAPAQAEGTKLQDSSPQVTVQFGAEVIDLDCHTCSVTLRSGEIHRGDVIIGADGSNGIVRATLMGREGAVSGRDDVPTGLAVYSTIIPKGLIVTDPDLGSFYEHPQSTLSMGSKRAAVTSTVGEDDDTFLWVFTPDGSQDGTWTRHADRKMAEILGSCDPQIRKLSALAGYSACIQIKDHYKLESWVSESGRVLVLGEAAHPSPPIALHAYSVSLEDGAFIGKVFSHTRDRERIPEFLHAFEEHRKPRCARILEMEMGYIDLITLPDGEKQLARDDMMRANHAVGRNVFDAPESRLQQMLDRTRMVFDYDPSDDADEWWVSWGRFRDPSRRESISINKI